MNPILAQFLGEARDFIQDIAQKLMQLEKEPENPAVMNELFRLVHTLKGNSGLFDFPEMTRVLHAGEDLMDAVRDGRLGYSREMADKLLDAMDFVSGMVDEIRQNGAIDISQIADTTRLVSTLRTLIARAQPAPGATGDDDAANFPGQDQQQILRDALADLRHVPESIRMDCCRAAVGGQTVHWLTYTPEAECFFKGENPLHQAMQVPELLWFDILPLSPWPAAADFDAYRSNLTFKFLTTADSATLFELFRYTPEQICLSALPPALFALPCGEMLDVPAARDFVQQALGALAADDIEQLREMACTVMQFAPAASWTSSTLRWLLLLLDGEPNHRLAHKALIMALESLEAPDWAALMADADMPAEQANTVTGASGACEQSALQMVLGAQYAVLSLNDKPHWAPGRLRAAASTLQATLKSLIPSEQLARLEPALLASLSSQHPAAMQEWLAEVIVDLDYMPAVMALNGESLSRPPVLPRTADVMATPEQTDDVAPDRRAARSAGNDAEVKFGRRADDSQAGPTTLKVEQSKIDRLMSLIGEMVVAKNALPYLADRAEQQYGMRDLAREIKAQHAVINRIAEEMQDGIMQVRMLPVSFIFQRFPRMVRDLSRKLGKEVNLVLVGEETEADKQIIESLADPLIHILRNSLDHGLELPAERIAAGKAAAGRLEIHAVQEADRVLIKISDDGKGIDPIVIRQKALEKGLIDEATASRLSNEEAVNLVFLPGFSTRAEVSDLSGRGVGMDVVRSALEKVSGSVQLASQVGRGTQITLSLPLSMAITNVMVIESDGQIFGVPMNNVIETVRLPNSRLRQIKQHQTAVLRGRVVPILNLNSLLVIDAAPVTNDEDEYATLVVRHHGEPVGIVVDNFRETVDIILKPLSGILGNLPGYAGTALLGDGSVLMILNLQELI